MAISTLPTLLPLFRQKIEYRLRKEGMSRREGKDAVDEMLCYLANAAEGKKEAPNKATDAAWHAAVLHTEDYRAFCLENFGHFMEHVPTWPPKAAGECTTCGNNCGCSWKTA